MKKFVLTALGIAIFFVGLGSLVDSVGARFKSDEKALDLVRKARVAIGGDAAINAVQSMKIIGQSTRSIKFDGIDKAIQGETEIALQFPDKFIRTSRSSNHDVSGKSEQRIEKQVDVVVVGDVKDKTNVTVTADAAGANTATNPTYRIVLRRNDGTVQELTGDEAAAFVASEHPGGIATLRKKEIANDKAGNEPHKIVVRKVDGGTWTGTNDVEQGEKYIVLDRKIDGTAGGGEAKTFARVAVRHNDFLRTTLGLLLTAPQGMDVSYTFAGEGDVDGAGCNMVDASFGGMVYRLYLSKSSNLPVMISYTGDNAPKMFTMRMKAADGAEPLKDVTTFSRVAGPGETGEYRVKFSDYRSVNGVQLPYKWTQTIGGAVDETFDVTAYEINPADIGEKFKNQGVMVRTAKPSTK